MYGMYTYIWLILMVNVGKHTIHGSYGVGKYYGKYHVQIRENRSPTFPRVFSGQKPSNIDP